jgi:hypothetical protein
LLQAGPAQPDSANTYRSCENDQTNCLALNHVDIDFSFSGLFGLPERHQYRKTRQQIDIIGGIAPLDTILRE